MEIGANVELEHSTSKRKIYVRGRGTKNVKSRRRLWTEEDMTMDPVDTKNDCIEKEVGLDYSTCRDEYFEKIVVCVFFVCRGKKQFK
jgi:hypothetical protein